MRTSRLTLVALAAAAVAPATALAATSSRAPDLKLTSLVDPPSISGPGASFSSQVVVTNTGASATKTSTTVEFYLQPDPDGTPEQRIKIGSTRVPALKAGVERIRATRLLIPAGTANGNYVMIACADPSERVSERFESNNCQAGSYSITSSDQLPPSGQPTTNPDLL